MPRRRNQCRTALSLRGKPGIRLPSMRAFAHDVAYSIASSSEEK
jgi:hypothetical protein